MNNAPQRSAIRPVLLCAALFLFFADSGGTLPTFSLPNEALTVHQARSVYLDGEWAIDEQFRVSGGFGSEDVTKSGGKSYPNKPPGATLWLLVWMPLVDLLSAGEPSFFFISYAGRVLAVSLPFAVWLYFFGRRLERAVRPELAWGTVLALALGTNASVYATLFFSHVPAMIAHGTAFLLIWRERPRAFLAGLCSGVGVLFENPTVFASFFLAWMLFSGKNARLVPLFFAGMIPAAAAQLLYQWKVFGSPWILPQSLMNDPVYAPGYRVGAVNPKAFAALFFGMPRGIFFHSPWMLAGLAAGIAAWPRMDGAARRLCGGAAALLAAQALFVSSYSAWHGGWSVGPRYLISAWPFAAAACAVAIASLEGRARKAAMIAAAAGACAALACHLLYLASVPYHPQQDAAPFSLNPARDLALAYLAQGYRAYTAADALGAPAAAAIAVFLTLWALPVAIYAASVFSNRSARKTALYGGAAGLCLTVLWLAAGASHPFESGDDLRKIKMRNWHGGEKGRP